MTLNTRSKLSLYILLVPSSTNFHHRFTLTVSSFPCKYLWNIWFFTLSITSAKTFYPIRSHVNENEKQQQQQKKKKNKKNKTKTKEKNKKQQQQQKNMLKFKALKDKKMRYCGELPSPKFSTKLLDISEKTPYTDCRRPCYANVMLKFCWHSQAELEANKTFQIPLRHLDGNKEPI